MTSKLKRSLNPNFNWRRWLDRGSGKKLNIRDAMAEAAKKAAAAAPKAMKAMKAKKA